MAEFSRAWHLARYTGAVSTKGLFSTTPDDDGHEAQSTPYATTSVAEPTLSANAGLGAYPHIKKIVGGEKNASSDADTSVCGPSCGMGGHPGSRIYSTRLRSKFVQRPNSPRPSLVSRPQLALFFDILLMASVSIAPLLREPPAMPAGRCLLEQFGLAVVRLSSVFCMTAVLSNAPISTVFWPSLSFVQRGPLV